MSPEKCLGTKIRAIVVLSAAVLTTLVSPALADRTKAVREAVEYVTRKFSKEAAEEGTQILTRKLTAQAVKHGDDAIVAFRKIGPQSIPLIEGAGNHAAEAVKLLAHMGNDAVWIVPQPRRLAIFVRWGDDAADALVKHKGVADGLIDDFGIPAAKALKSIDGQQGRRLEMMRKSGELAKITRTDELLGVIGKHGDRAADFVWRNKGALATATALTAFLSDPEPFIDGARDVAVEMAKGPLTAMVSHANWPLITAIVLVIVGAFLLVRRTSWKRRRLHARTPNNRAG